MAMHRQAHAERAIRIRPPPRCSDPSAAARPRSSFFSFVLVLLACSWSCRASGAVVGSCLSGSTPFVLSSACAPGYYCPLYNASEPETYPVQCAPTDDCIIDRLTTQRCEAQGTYEPVLCDAGSYCPTPTQRLPCPSGHYCPLGSAQPIECGGMMECGEGKSKKFDYSSIIALLVTDAAAVLLYCLALAWRKRQHAARDQTYGAIQAASGESKLYTRGAVYSQLPAHSQLLCRGFMRARGQLPPMRLEFDNLSLTIPQKGGKEAEGLTILKGVTGSIEPASVTAVMGPSGAGKTTFLNVLLGKTDPSWQRGGVLHVNGVEESLGRFRRVMGFVPQEDTMHRDLSVYDNVRYSGLVRLPREWSTQQREDHINATIAAMQLQNVQDTPIGDEMRRGVSGGQRKRANIGMEVASAPLMLALDEPTSGLDSKSALDICGVLKDLARVTQLTVVMVVHQPRVEIWEQLDELLLLAPGGLTCYQGPQVCALHYFEQRFDIRPQAHHNPADWLMDCIAGQADEFVRAWRDGGKEHVQRLRRAQRQEKRRAAAAGTADARDGPLLEEDEDDLAPLPSASPPIEPPPEHMAVAVEPESEAAEPAAAVALDGYQLAAGGPGGRVAGARSAEARSPVSSRSASHDGYLGAIPIQVEPRGRSASGQRSLLPAGDSMLQSTPPAFSERASLRHTRGFVQQVGQACVRSLWKQSANLGSLALEIGLGLIAGIAIGAMATITWQAVLLPPYTLLSSSPLDNTIGALFGNVGMAISLAAASAGVSVFSEELAQYRREVGAGHAHLAYYLGVNLAQFPRLFLDALHYATAFHLLSQPLTPFGPFLGIVFLLYCATYGLAFLVSMLVARKNAALLAVVLCLFMGFMTGKGGFPEPMQYLSASRWATEAMFSYETDPYAHVMDVADAAHRLGYQRGRVPLDLGLMFLLGMLYRAVAYVAMAWNDRNIIKHK